MNLMYQAPILNDVHRKLSEIVIGARGMAAAEDGRILVEHAARGLAFSGNVISEVAKRLDELHADAIEQAVRLTHGFAARGLDPRELSQSARSVLENFGDEFINRVPFLGNEALNPATEQVRSRYRAIFKARLDSALRDIEIGFAGGQNMAMPIKDADRRAVILKRFYDERHIRSWVGFPTEPNASQEEKLITADICVQLDEGGLIEWKTPARGLPEGMGRITSLGVDVVEGNATAPIAISIDRSISVSGSTHVQIGDGNVQDLHVNAEKVVAAINHSTASDAEKEEAKSLFGRLLDNPILSKIVGLIVGAGN